MWDILEDLFPEYLPKLKYYSCEIFVGLTKNGDLFVRAYPFDKDNYIFIIDNEPISGNDLVNYINSISKIVK